MTTEKIPEKQPMDIGNLANPTTIFVRKFRWTLAGIDLDPTYVSKVSFDFAKKTIQMECLEVILKDSEDMSLHSWLEQKCDPLAFTTYDGCGEPLYQYRFSDIKIESDVADFDYDCSDISVRKVMMTYGSVERAYYHKGELKVKKDGYVWTMNLVGSKEQYDITLKDRPTIDIEETEINFLNGKTWIPGKAKWQELEISIKRQHNMDIIVPLLQDKKPSICLNLYSLDKKKLLETWTLNGCVTKRMNSLVTCYNISLGYANVEYRNGDENVRDSKSGRKAKSRNKG